MPKSNPIRPFKRALVICKNYIGSRVINSDAVPFSGRWQQRECMSTSRFLNQRDLTVSTGAETTTNRSVRGRRFELLHQMYQELFVPGVLNARFFSLRGWEFYSWTSDLDSVFVEKIGIIQILLFVFYIRPLWNIQLKNSIDIFQIKDLNHLIFMLLIARDDAGR